MKRYELPNATVSVVKSLCADYLRMKAALKKGSLKTEVQLTYYTYTFAIYDAASRAVGLVGCQAEELIVDIGASRGYQHSSLAALITRSRYNRAKSRAIYLIATSLYLCEGKNKPVRHKDDE